MHIFSLGSDPEKLFSFKMMQDHFRKYAKFGLILSTILLPMITSDSGNAVDLDGLSDAIKNGEDVDQSVFVSEASLNRLNRRLRDVVADMVRLEYIWINALKLFCMELFLFVFLLLCFINSIE